MTILDVVRKSLEQDGSEKAVTLLDAMNTVHSGTTATLTQLHKAITLELLSRPEDVMGQTVVATKMVQSLMEILSIFDLADAVRSLEGENR